MFIQDEGKANRLRQPDHWNDSETPVGFDLQPVTGVRVQDALAFCDWLSIKMRAYKLEQKGLQFRFRLPTEKEATTDPINNISTGCWCSSFSEYSVAGVNAGYIDIWQSQLNSTIIKQIEPDLTRDLDLPIHLDDDEIARDSALESIRNRNHATVHIQRLFSRECDLARLSRVNIYALRSSADKLEAALQKIQRQFHELRKYKVLAYDLSDALRRANSFELLRSYLLLIHIIWDTAFNVIQNTIPKASKPNEALTKFAQMADQSYDIYTLITLIDMRRNKYIPAWESIRVVCEIIP